MFFRQIETTKRNATITNSMLENASGDVGFVPSNFFRYSSTTRNGTPSTVNGNSNGFGDVRSSGPNHHQAQSSSSSSGHPHEYKEGPMAVDAAIFAIAKYNYEPTRPDELRLTRGDSVRVLEQSSDGWWNGELNGQTGWFPSNYVETAPAPSTQSSNHQHQQFGGHGDVFAAATNGGGSDKVLETVHALYNFDAQSAEELSFRQGDILDIIEHPEHDPEWWRARNAAGQTGLVPTNYIKVVSANGSSNGAKPASTNGNGQVLTGPYAAQAWYFGLLSRSQAENLLHAKARDGDFLVRDSESNIGDYSISLKGPKRPMHFWIQVKGSNFCIGSRSFPSMDQLIQHYMKSPIFNDDQTGETLYLVRPLPR
uniref:SH3 domain-containing protein n=1 Tax=Panagrellus redivivus TaxID=6233 RepID=A0A7E4URR4_PANRE